MTRRAWERENRPRTLPYPMPADATCRDCYEWGPQVWKRTCAWDCQCAHHADEIWLAAGAPA